MLLYRMPNEEEMLRRLRAVCHNDYTEERYYSLLTRSAGVELYPIGIVNMLVFDAAEAFGDGPALAALSLFFPMFIDALVDDKQIATDAKKFWVEVRQGGKK